MLRVTLTRTSEGNRLWWMKMKIRVQTFIQSQESGYMCRWITVSDNQQDERSKKTTKYNHIMNLALESEFMTQFTQRSSSKRRKKVSIRLSKVENLGIYNKKKQQKNYIFENFVKKAENSVQ